MSEPINESHKAAIADRKAVLEVLNQSRGLSLDVVAAQVIMALDERGFRRPEPPAPMTPEEFYRSLVEAVRRGDS